MSAREIPAWPEIHKTATVIDLHAHPALKAVLFRRNLTRRFRAARNFFSPISMRTNFIKLHEGGVDVLFSAIYIPEWPLLQAMPWLHVLRVLHPGVWRQIMRPSYFQATLNALSEMEAQVSEHNRGRDARYRPVKIARTMTALDELIAQGAEGPIALVHCVEGGHSLHGERAGKTVDPDMPAEDPAIERELMANLEALPRQGVAYVTLAHFYPNHLVSPVFPFPEGLLPLTRQSRVLREHDPGRGLTEMGARVTERLFELGMLADISHCTPSARARIYQIADSLGVKSQVIATHVGAYSLNPSLYNLQDWEIKWIADHGGVIGVIFMNYWLMPKETGLGLNAVSRTLDHFVRVGGSEQAAGFGSDWDGFTDPPDELVDASWLPKFTQRLLAERRDDLSRRYSDDAVAKILGGNALRVFREGWRGPETQ